LNQPSAACPEVARRAGRPEYVLGIGAVDKDDFAPHGTRKSRRHLEDEDGIGIALRVSCKLLVSCLSVFSQSS
jgi:hypothetical protein